MVPNSFVGGGIPALIIIQLQLLQPCEGGKLVGPFTTTAKVGIAIPKMVLVTARPLITLGVDGLNIWQKQLNSNKKNLAITPEL